MKKQELLRIFIIVSSVLFAVLLLANIVKVQEKAGVKETASKESDKSNTVVSSFEYNAKTEVAPLKNEIIIYDGKN